MVTFVGTQGDFADAIKDLIELDFDAIEAYDAAINRIENQSYRDKLIEFKGDHERHVRELSALLKKHNEEAPTGPSIGKQWITKGKTILANLIGDRTILVAMRSNEVDTNTAYERVYHHEGKWEDADDILKRGLKDERRHKAWLEEATNMSL